jgi:hypothetical protein
LAALVWCNASLVATAQQVRIGVILNMASPIAQRRRVGIEMALEDYYSARPGSAARVALRFQDSGGDAIGAASAGKLDLCVLLSDYTCSLPAMAVSGHAFLFLNNEPWQVFK